MFWAKPPVAPYSAPGGLRLAFGKVSIVSAGAPVGLLHPALWFVTADPS